jgi:hypothetical protein
VAPGPAPTPAPTPAPGVLPFPPPTVTHWPSPVGVGRWPRRPQGFIWHGTRSGVRKSLYDEWRGTANYATQGARGVGWQVTAGPNAPGARGGGGNLAVHLPPTVWAWHAYDASSSWFGIETAQTGAGGVLEEMDDPTAWAIAWYIARVAIPATGAPLRIITHAEAEALGYTVRRVGKTDYWPFGDKRADRDRERLLRYSRQLLEAA